jgi:hypothetical protein
MNYKELKKDLEELEGFQNRSTEMSDFLGIESKLMELIHELYDSLVQKVIESYAKEDYRKEDMEYFIYEKQYGKGVPWKRPIKDFDKSDITVDGKDYFLKSIDDFINMIKETWE